MKQKKAAIRSIGHIKMHLFPILSVIYPVKIIPIKDPISNIPYNKIINLRLNYFNFQILYYLKKLVAKIKIHTHSFLNKDSLFKNL